MVQPLQGDVVPLVHHDRGINGVDVLVDLVLMPPLVPGREEPAHERSRKNTEERKNRRVRNVSKGESGGSIPTECSPEGLLEAGDVL